MPASADAGLPRFTRPAVAGRRVALAVTVAVALCGAVATAHAQTGGGMTVADFAWTDGVAADRNVGTSLRSVRAGQPLYFWTRIVGDASTLSRMEQDGRLPLHHVWYRVIGGMSVQEGTSAPDDERSLATDEIALSQTSSAVVAALWRELRLRNGWFDFRTWSMKEAPRAGYWYVKVTDNKGRPIGCAQARDGCRILIQVTR